MEQEIEQWRPNENLLEILVTMGITKNAAEIALYYTGNESADAAATFYFDNPDIEGTSLSVIGVSDEKDVKTVPKDEGDDSSEEDDSKNECVTCKMVFIINSALNMGIGKIAAQVAHASLGLYRNLIHDRNMTEELGAWEEYGEKKIVLKGTNDVHLQELQKLATEKNIHSYLVRDAGRTQIPEGSITVLGLFGEENLVNTVSGKLGLL
ncbi:peptidyl-trna hydrolase 2 [Holotrichia oblita]|uniref:Peptidyl-trna hydrolase 2 n=2 Tax=Holotrichia oblita TaxID=644536 RepID=A0ACB9SY70_HOLOL|nr:peptidyl-trna hydrolase 2 [Holotrichia oblita]KAI4459509.1 peptidyl-trna hydrolase 2 [Holotrichia oblita]